jgi:hypothetical protein
MALTKRQKDVLDFIAHFVEEHGYSPDTGGDASAHGSVDRRFHQFSVGHDARHRAYGDAVAVVDFYVREGGVGGVLLGTGRNDDRAAVEGESW